MSTSRGFNINDAYSGTNFDNLDNMQLPMQRFTPIELRSDNLVYQNQETRNGDRYRILEPVSKRSKFCSKRCLIGLAIGLTIGILMVIAAAVPLGVIPRCGVGILSSTPNWIGTFLMDNQCDTTACCCLSNQITLTQTIGYQMQIAGSAIGQCALFGSAISLIVPMSTSFQIDFSWATETIRLQLGQDNAYVSFVNIYHGRCSATAVRTSYNGGSMKSMNMGNIMFILLILIGIMRS